MARRQSQWFTAHSGPTDVLSGVILSVDFTAAYLVASGLGSMRGYTLVRTLGELAIRPATTAGTEILDCAAGIIIMTGGAAPNVSPQTDNADWLWHYTGGVGQDGGFAMNARTRYIDVSSLAQRKQAQQETRIFFVFQNASAVLVRIHIGLRQLFKLP